MPVLGMACMHLHLQRSCGRGPTNNVSRVRCRWLEEPKHTQHVPRFQFEHGLGCRPCRQAARPCKIVSFSATCRLLDHKQRYTFHLACYVIIIDCLYSMSCQLGHKPDHHSMLHADDDKPGSTTSQRHHFHTQPWHGQEQQQQSGLPDAALTTAAPAGIASSSPLPSSQQTPALGSPNNPVNISGVLSPQLAYSKVTIPASGLLHHTCSPCFLVVVSTLQICVQSV